MNILARNGIEITLWPCEGSTRQEWTLNDDGQFEVYGHNWLGDPTKSCLGKKPDDSFEGLLLSDCGNSNVTASFTQTVLNETLNTINLIVENSDNVDGENCLVVFSLTNNGGAYGPRGGAQVTIGKCDEPTVSTTCNFILLSFEGMILTSLPSTIYTNLTFRRRFGNLMNIWAR